MKSSRGGVEEAASDPVGYGMVSQMTRVRHVQLRVLCGIAQLRCFIFAELHSSECLRPLVRGYQGSGDVYVSSRCIREPRG